MFNFAFIGASGGVVTGKHSCPISGGPLADTDIALKKLPIRGGALAEGESSKNCGWAKEEWSHIKYSKGFWNKFHL